MPIYAYRCDECGFAKDVLQKISDPVLTVCPSCGKSSFKKQVTAAGFQLKGTGWYVTDFRGGSAPATGTAPAAEGGGSAGTGTSAGSDSSSSASAAPAPAAAPASTSGTSGDA
jgi:putative FmdB family regulatory protein